MKKDRIVELVLVESDVDGIVEASLFNKSVQALKIPRKLCYKMGSLNIEVPGIFVLYGLDDADNKLSWIIRESQNIYKDVKELIDNYENSKDSFYWTKGWFFTNLPLTGSDLYKLKIWTNEYLKVGNVSGVIKKMEKYILSAKLVDLLDDIIVLGSALGMKPEVDSELSFENAIYRLDNADGVSAKMVLTSDGVVVLKGSVFSSKEVAKKYEYTTWAKVRKNLERNFILEDGVLQENVSFNSPKFAEYVILGEETYGHRNWVNSYGQFCVL